MSGTEILIDTNIALYLLAGSQPVADVLQGNRIYISFVSELELLGFRGVGNEQIKLIKKLLADCTIVDINAQIKEQTVALRKSHSIKLPDAIIASTAIVFKIPMFTADKGFKKVKGLQLALFEP